jgi:sterol desaturase/sphingolipid hydroxylase (fatty acid hydroxylase superfamily)
VLDEQAFGTRTPRGEWVPFRRASYGPLFRWPPQPAELLRWFFGLPGYLLPFNMLYACISFLVWRFATPSADSMRSLALAPIAFILARNLVLVCLWFGAIHWLLYIRRNQGTQTKYNERWPRASERFMFGSQNRENVFWTLASAVPVWTAFEVVTLWLSAHDRLPQPGWSRHPLWFAAMLLLIPLWREVHFYAVHRLIHSNLLYERVHALHHRNTNPGPWSGLSMHPVEHLLYFTCVVIHWVIASHPLHAMFTLIHAGMSPAPGQSGFECVTVGPATIQPGGWNHYLHHKYFEVNYADGAIPFDKWFGSFHDGSPEAHEAMKARIAARRRTSAPL